MAHMDQSKYTQKRAFLCHPAQFSCSPKILVKNIALRGGSRFYGDRRLGGSWMGKTVSR
jgi:hypothetical protein